MASYFQKCAEYYIFSIITSGADNKRLLGERCRAKYPRGINLVAVEHTKVGDTFTPDFCVDPGRIFLTYNRLMNDALDPRPDPNEEAFREIKRLIDTYDPEKQLLFFVLKVGGGLHTEGYVYKVDI